MNSLFKRLARGPAAGCAGMQNSTEPLDITLYLAVCPPPRAPAISISRDNLIKSLCKSRVWLMYSKEETSSSSSGSSPARNRGKDYSGAEQAMRKETEPK